jgi:uncharacterized protein HemX
MTDELKSSPTKKPQPIAYIALGLSVATLLLSAYNLERHAQATHKTVRMQDQLQARVAAVSTATAVFQHQLGAIQKNIPLSSEKTLAEASYLINIANTQLSLEYDATAALQTLKVTQNLLADSKDPRFMALSAAVQSDRESLMAAPTLHTSQLFLQLSNIIQQVQTLSTLPSAPNLALQPVTVASDIRAPWYKRLWESLSALKGLILIRHDDAANAPLIAPNMEMYLKQNITSQLVMAQWALLHHNQGVYTDALQNAITWVSRYFALTAEKNVMSATLTQLLSENVHPTYPTLSHTMSAFAEFKISATDMKAPDIAAPVAPVKAPNKPAQSVETRGPSGVEA